MELTQAQQAVVTKLADHAVRQAAVALAEAMDESIDLSVSDVVLTDQAAAMSCPGGCQDCPSVAVRQEFLGDFSGEALLVLCESACLDLVRTLLTDAVPLDGLTDLEQDAVCEIGNVVLNHCLSGLAVALGGSLTSGLPRYQRDAAARLIGGRTTAGARTALVLPLQVVFPSRSVKGYIILLMLPDAVGRFVECVDNHLQKA